MKKQGFASAMVLFTAFAALILAVNLKKTSANEYGRVLSSYATKIAGGDVNRLHNIKLAAKAMDGTILMPGEEFSFNERIGPTGKTRGFLLARIFVKGQDKKGYGGGVCQVSSTLFNAAEMAGLEITERHPHSKKVKYVPEGRDAATSYGGIDLKFRNNFNFPVYIRSYTDRDSVVVSVFAVE